VQQFGIDKTPDDGHLRPIHVGRRKNKMKIVALRTEYIVRERYLITK
jgi:hypothetical protein